MATQNFIKVRGARVHNLQNINVDIPKDKLVVITGISGSGKSSLAFDTLYAEGQRRYVESLSAYARQFLGVMQKPDVDKIENINPAIAIDQRRSPANPRSTVGTITEIHDYLRLLFGRVGEPYCPKCGLKVASQSIDQMIEQIKRLKSGTEIIICAPLIRGKKGQHKDVLEEVQKAGFIRVFVDKKLYRIEEALKINLDKNKRHNIEVVVDRVEVLPDLERSRLADSLEMALKMGKGTVMIIIFKSKTKNQRQIPNYQSQIQDYLIFSEKFACQKCGQSLPELEPRLFSFNSPYGACPACQGLGEKLEVAPELVIPNKNLSISEGAIRPWMRASHKIGRQSYFWWQLSNLAQKYNFSLNVPVKELPQKIINIILYGEGTDDNFLVKSKIQNSKLETNSQDTFEGVIPQLERRYHQTDSEYTREEIEQYMIERICEVCKGKRLRPEALAVKVGGQSIDQLESLPLKEALAFFKNLSQGQGKHALEEKNLVIALPILKEIISRLQFMVDVGLDYLSLDRKVSTLSGGEQERIRLATQIGSQLSGVLYILDEPSVGLHPRDINRLIFTLKRLRDLKNTVIVVEHDPATIKAADWILEIGPGAGKHGGRIIFEGTPKKLLKSHTLTGDYLSGRKRVEIEAEKIQIQNSRFSARSDSKFLVIRGAKEHNLKNIDVRIPLGKLVCITGVSGSGKSTLVDDILARALLRHFYGSKLEPGKHTKIEGIEFIDKVAIVDQSPIGRTPRSNPATYIGAFSYIRELFAKTPQARARGYLPGRFSFNVKGGRCEVCEGQGLIKVEMYFLPDVYVECSECSGQRYNQETLSITYKGKNIAQVLRMSVEEALEFFKFIPPLRHRLGLLAKVGLDYLELGQPATTLSGGEAQRIKLTAELAKKATGRTLYILDEPTTGLHPHDISKLLYVLRELVNLGNTILVVEHNLDFIKTADWIIDLGPGGGPEGGKIVIEGTPQQVARHHQSYTGRYLSNFFR